MRRDQKMESHGALEDRWSVSGIEVGSAGDSDIEDRGWGSGRHDRHIQSLTLWNAEDVYRGCRVSLFALFGVYVWSKETL